MTFISDPMTLKISSAMPTQIMNICAANFIEIAPLSRGIASHEIGVKRRTDGRTADRRTYCLHLEFFDGGGRTNTQILLVFVFQLMLPGASIVQCDQPVRPAAFFRVKTKIRDSNFVLKDV